MNRTGKLEGNQAGKHADTGMMIFLALTKLRGFHPCILGRSRTIIGCHRHLENRQGVNRGCKKREA